MTLETTSHLTTTSINTLIDCGTHSVGNLPIRSLTPLFVCFPGVGLVVVPEYALLDLAQDAIAVAVCTLAVRFRCLSRCCRWAYKVNLKAMMTSAKHTDFYGIDRAVPVALHRRPLRHDDFLRRVQFARVGKY